MPFIDRRPDIKTPTLRVSRPYAETWIVNGRLGTPTLPHVFAAIRTRWQLNANHMQMGDIQIATVELVPGGNIKAFGERLAAMQKTVIDLESPLISSRYTYADISRSIEAEPRIHELVPNCTVAKLLNSATKGWSLPFMEIGRPLILSKLQVLLSDHKITDAMHPTSDDPLRWTWKDVRAALNTISHKPPQLADDTADQSLEDDVIMCLGLAIYCTEQDQPSKWQNLGPIKPPVG